MRCIGFMNGYFRSGYMDGYFGSGTMHGMGYFNYGSFFLMGIGIVLIIALLFLLFRHNKSKSAGVSDEVEEALKLRYVNGEITEEEYKKMKKNLS